MGDRPMQQCSLFLLCALTCGPLILSIILRSSFVSPSPTFISYLRKKRQATYVNVLIWHNHFMADTKNREKDET